MDDNLQITNAEMRVMEVIWESSEMMTVPEIVERLQNDGEDWAYQTVATFLRRLNKKGALGVTKKGNNLYYFSLISESKFKKGEARSFVENRFNGSLKGFLAAFKGKNGLKDSEIKELKEWLDEFDR